MTAVSGPGFAFLAGVPFRQLLRGRTGAMVDLLVARGCRVAFFEYPPPSLKDLVQPDLNSTHRWHEYLWPRVDWQSNPAVVLPIPRLPFAGRNRTIRKWDLRRLTHWFRRQSRRSADVLPRPRVAVVSNPWWAQFLQHGDFDILCCDLIDDPIVFSGPELYRQFLNWEDELIAQSDIVTYSAEALRDKALRNPRARHLSLPNAVNARWFRDRSAALPEPEDIAAISHPRAGFVGSIFHWTDLDTAALVIRSMPDVSFVFIGPLERPEIIDSLRGFANFHYLGPKPPDRIPVYVRSLDVCLSFFRRDQLAAAVDPVKVYEYLALGKPVVATPLPEFARFGDLVRVAEDPDSLARGIRESIAEHDPDLPRRRQAFADANSWDQRIDQLLAAIREVRARR
jgi:glycosyltransferase involved in cell wall biosynthesis